LDQANDRGDNKVKLKTRLLAGASTLAIGGSMFLAAAPVASADPTPIGGCSGSVGLATFTDAAGLASELGDQTAIGITVKTKLLKGKTSKATLGGACQAVGRPGSPEMAGGQPTPLLLTPKALSGKLQGNLGCAQGPTAQAVDATAAATWPANGKLTWTMTTTNGAGKPWQIQADVALLGFSPDFPDVVNVGGIVLKGAAVGATVLGDLWQDPVALETVGVQDPSDIYDTGYKVDTGPALGCADGTAGNAHITMTEFGSGGTSATSLLGSNTNGIVFLLGQ
jgi:hypothetical protein